MLGSALPPRPSAGRVFTSARRIRLSDADETGRLRLDAVARYLQDVASDDVADAGWSSDEHVWIVRRTELHVVEPFAGDEAVELATWCSGVGASAAGRRYSLAGDRGGRIEAESVWAHLGRDMQPARLGERFLAVYAAAAEGRRVSPRLSLRPATDAEGRPWVLRATDVDVLGHVNNAVYWIPVEEALAAHRELAGGPLTAVVEYRRPVDLGEDVRIVETARPSNEVPRVTGGVELSFAAGPELKAAAELVLRR